jgi:hypothetical protein
MRFTRARQVCSSANPYLESNAAITYRVIKTSDGWKIEADLPTRVSPKDRAKVIRWFHAYRMNVRKHNPLWLANFRVSENGYILDIKPFNDVRKLAEAGEEVKELWDDTVKYAER